MDAEKQYGASNGEGRHDPTADVFIPFDRVAMFIKRFVEQDNKEGLVEEYIAISSITSFAHFKNGEETPEDEYIMETADRIYDITQETYNLLLSII